MTTNVGDNVETAVKRVNRSEMQTLESVTRSLKETNQGQSNKHLGYGIFLLMKGL
jgi:hypothetical protein